MSVRKAVSVSILVAVSISGAEPIVAHSVALWNRRRSGRLCERESLSLFVRSADR